MNTIVLFVFGLGGFVTGIIAEKLRAHYSKYLTHCPKCSNPLAEWGNHKRKCEHCTYEENKGW